MKAGYLYRKYNFFHTLLWWVGKVHQKIDNWRRGRSGIDYIESYVSPDYSQQYSTARMTMHPDNNGPAEYCGCLIKKISTGVYQIRYYDQKYKDVPKGTPEAIESQHGSYLSIPAKYFMGVVVRNTKIELHPSGIKKIVYKT